MEKKERQIGLDIIRALAIIFVFMTHGIQYKGFLDGDVTSIKWAVVLFVRFMALSCVPLFILLTGFLNNKKEISKKYYKGIIPLLISYVVITFIELVGVNLVSFENGALSFSTDKLSQINWPVGIVKLFNFTENSYAWYFEMYIGLFLLIPFLNILWDGLKNKKERIILIVTCAFLTLIPKTIEGFRYPWIKGDDLAGWLDVLPDFWKIAHPLAYFFIGKYIKEYKPNPKLLIKIMMVIISIAVPTLCCYYASQRTGGYAWYVCNGFGTITNAFVAYSLFVLFYTTKFKVPVLSQIITQISICSFEMYLFSSIFDKIFYNCFPQLNIALTVGCVLISTFICARIFITLRNLLFKRLYS